MKKTEIGSFQNVINLVHATGVGIKKFIFRANMSYDEIMNLDSPGELVPELPKDDLRDGTLIIKFSDGSSHIGSLVLTREEVIHADEGSYSAEPPIFGFHIDTSDHEVQIRFHFEVYPIGDGTVGDAYIEVYPVREKMKGWYEEGM